MPPPLAVAGKYGITKNSISPASDPKQEGHMDITEEPKAKSVTERTQNSNTTEATGGGSTRGEQWTGDSGREVTGEGRQHHGRWLAPALGVLVVRIPPFDD